jgi:hypothetical protein
MTTEYDKGTTDSLPSGPEKPGDHAADLTSGGGPGRGHLRVDGDKVDVSILKDKIVFPFSGKVAPNRFLKAPMTERLCPWPENHAEDKVRMACSWNYPMVKRCI